MSNLFVYLEIGSITESLKQQCGRQEELLFADEEANGTGAVVQVVAGESDPATPSARRLPNAPIRGLIRRRTADHSAVHRILRTFLDKRFARHGHDRVAAGRYKHANKLLVSIADEVAAGLSCILQQA